MPAHSDAKKPGRPGGEAAKDALDIVHEISDGYLGFGADEAATVLAQRQTAPAARPGKQNQPSSVKRGDPFDDAVVLTNDDREAPPLPVSRPDDPPIQLARQPRSAVASASRDQIRRAATPSSRGRLLVVAALALVALLAVVILATRRAPVSHVAEKPAKPRPKCHVTLAVNPRDATVQLDQTPMLAEDLLLDEGTRHVIHVAAAGRVARSISFDARIGLELSVYLDHTLPLPTPSDPTAIPDERSPDYPAHPATRDQITQALAKLDRYAACLALLNDSDEESPRNAKQSAPPGVRMSRCVQLLDEASALKPEMPELHRAAHAYLLAAHKGQKPAMVRQALQRFASEFLATRTEWQMEELARQESDGGRTAGWAMRRFGLATLAWLRGSGKSPRATLDESHRALLELAQKNPQAIARMPGADEFMAAAREVVALAHGEPGKRSVAASAIAASQRLVTAFNALVVD